MRKLLATSFLLLSIMIGAAGVAPAAHAQFESLVDSPLSEQQANSAASSVVSGTSGAASSQNNIPSNPDLGGGEKAFGSVMTWIMSLFAWLVGVAALILDYTVYYTVVRMGDYVNNLSAIGVTWTILRDIGNILLIFGFVAVGVTTILKVDWYGGGKKMLPMMLVAAVFLNFSLFIAEAVVDTGNLFATQFYTQINGGGAPAEASLSGVTNAIAGEAISNAIMGKLGFQTLYNAGKVNPQIYQTGNTWLIGFLRIILFLVTAFVLFSLSFILIMRFVALVFIIIVAPVGFAGLAIPGLAGKASQWWSQLFSQTITAPIMLLMLYIALRVITDVNFMTGLCSPSSSGTGTCSKTWYGTVEGGDLVGFASLLLSFLIAIGLLLLVVVMSKRWSAFGGDWATKTAGKFSFGVAGWAGRNTVGWGAAKSAKYLRSTWVARTPLAGTGLVRGLDKVAGSNFDLRTPVKNVPAVGINAGDAQKGGYKADLKARTDARVNYAKELKGRELTDEEKMRQTRAQVDIKGLEKTHKAAQARWSLDDKARNELLKELEGKRSSLTKEEFEAREKEINDSMKEADESVKKAKENLEKRRVELRSIESVTDKGAQRKYATVLNLGMDEKGFFNKYINFAANTDAAKKIRDSAKESSDDKALKSLKEAIKKVGEEEAPAEPAKPASGEAIPGSGGETKP